MGANRLDDYVEDPKVRAALDRLLRLQMMILVRESAADFWDLLDGDQVDALVTEINVLLAEIRPDAVGLTDAFSYDDYQLSSTLGRYDGKVYEAIYEEAQKSPLNKSTVMVGWDKLSPILDLDFLKQGVGQRWVPSPKM